jgi:hypothetical protein
MSDDVASYWEHLEAIRREAGWLKQQIQESQGTIERSQELIRRADELLASRVAAPKG